MAVDHDPDWGMPLTNWQPHGSYITPITIPSTGPDGGTTLCLPPISQEWLPIIVGCLDQLQLPTTWGPVSDATMEQVLSWSEQLKLLVAQAGPCMQLRWSDADCAVEESSDGGVTWTKISGWPVGAPPCLVGAPGSNGTNGINGTNGTNGVTPQLRWSGCSFQVSVDGGATWANLSGFDISTLQGCLTGIPGNPQGVSTAQQACNIAAYLASQVLQASMAQAATELSGGASLFTATLAILGVASLLTGVGEIALAAAAAFFYAAGGISTTNLNAAAADATLKSNLTCAIYGAIAADGYVTSANFGAVSAAIGGLSYATPGIIGLLQNYWDNLGFVSINAIQGEGSLYAGDCSACGLTPTWCFRTDLTLAMGHWALRYTPGADGHWVAGTGVVGDLDAGGGFNNWEADIALTGITYELNSVTVEFVRPQSDTHSQSFINLRNGGTDLTFTALPTGASGSLQTATISLSHTVGTDLFVRVSQQTNGTGLVIKAVTVRGNGLNPLGASNCT